MTEPRRCIHDRTERQRCAQCNAMELAASQPPSGDAPDLREALTRLFDTVRLMRTFIGHEHREPWPCPVFFVDEAMRAVRVARATYEDGPYPDDLRAVYESQMAALAASAPSSPATPAPLEVERLQHAMTLVAERHGVLVSPVWFDEIARAYANQEGGEPR